MRHQNRLNMESLFTDVFSKTVNLMLENLPLNGVMIQFAREQF